MRLALTTVILLSICDVSIGQERLVDSFHVIYREASDDYLFRVRYSYEPDFWTLTARNPPSTAVFPDTHLSFEFIRGTSSLGGISSLEVPATGLLSVYDNDSFVGQAPFTVDGKVFEAVVDRDVFGIPLDDPLVDFVFWTTHENVGTYPHAYLVSPVALNVPEPSALVLTAAAIAPLSIFVRRRLRSIRAAT